MLLKNIDLEKGLANGSRGVIVGFQRPKNERSVDRAHVILHCEPS
jgi:hypothetical protein